MTIAINSYGDVDEIASLCPRLADAITYKFTTATRPTLTQAESFTDQVSSVLNIMLAEQGFKIPISQADCKLALDLFVNQEVAAIAEGINGQRALRPGRWKRNSQRPLCPDDGRRQEFRRAAGGRVAAPGRSAHYKLDRRHCLSRYGRIRPPDCADLPALRLRQLFRELGFGKCLRVCN